MGVGVFAVFLVSVSQPCSADSFTYDALNRLTRAVFANGSAITYTYDAMGNLLSTANTSLFSAPDAPTAVTATPGNGSADISFTAPANNGGDAITGYTVTSIPAGGVDSNAGTTALTHTITGLSNGTAYTFTVTAANNAGSSTASVASNSVTPVAPIITFTASASAGANGSISPASQAVTQGNATSFTVTPDAGYTASASGCGGSLNGSAYTTGTITADCTVNATFTQNAIQANLVTGWNLVGNSVNAPLDVAATLGNISNVTTVWKWIPATSKWAFYAPSMSATDLATYAAGKGYDVLATINGGEGFWVNAKAAFNISLPSGAAVQSSSFMPAVAATAGGTHALPHGWSLIATGDSPTPAQFDTAIATPLTTLWAWDAARAGWYFWAPGLVNSGSLAGYIASKNYLDFATLPTIQAGTLSPTTGFWVNRP